MEFAITIVVDIEFFVALQCAEAGKDQLCPTGLRGGLPFRENGPGAGVSRRDRRTAAGFAAAYPGQFPSVGRYTRCFLRRHSQAA